MKKNDSVHCETDFRFHVNLAYMNLDIMAITHVYFHLVRGDSSYISEYGTVEVNGKKYFLDRNVKLFFSERERNGYHEVRRDGVDKNPQDNVPDEIYEAMSSRQKLLYFRVSDFGDDFWQISDLRRTIVICKKKENTTHFMY
ncbi:hypothetical protein [Pantoea agglomerans]|uniref:hypothetical protein n=1 Tax=Enterobacter agglomerans TaxID=549 RepID=UPI003C7E7586